MWLSRTPSASQIRAIEESDGAVRSRSSWLMKPLVSPVAAASCSIVRPRSRRSERTRAPTFGVSFRTARGVARGMPRSYAGLAGTAHGGRDRLAIIFVADDQNALAREEPRVSTLLLVPLEDIVVFPNMNVTLTVDVGSEERVLLVPRHDNDYAKVGTVAEVTDRVRLPGGGRAVALAGLHRGLAGAAETDWRGRLRVAVEERPDDETADGRTRELEREYRAIVEEILELRGDDGRISAFVRSIT